MQRCAQCGEENQDAALLCWLCKEPLHRDSGTPHAAPAPHATPVPPPPASPPSPPSSTPKPAAAAPAPRRAAVQEVVRHPAAFQAHLPPELAPTIRSIAPIVMGSGGQSPPSAHEITPIAGRGGGVGEAAEPWKAQPHLLELKPKTKADGSGRRTTLLFVLALASVALLLYKRHEQRELEQAAAMARRSSTAVSAPAAVQRTEPPVTEHLAAPTPAPPPSAERAALVEEPAFAPPARPATGPRSANEVLRTAITKARAAEWEDARLDVQHAIELAPRSAIAHYWRGVILEAQEERGMAAGEFKHAIELDPAEGHAYRELANLYAHAGQHEKAIEVLGQLIARSPRWEDGYAYYARGLSFRALKKERRAGDDLKQACALGTRSACPQPTPAPR